MTTAENHITQTSPVPIQPTPQEVYPADTANQAMPQGQWQDTTPAGISADQTRGPVESPQYPYSPYPAPPMPAAVAPRRKNKLRNAALAVGSLVAGVATVAAIFLPKNQENEEAPRAEPAPASQESAQFTPETTAFPELVDRITISLAEKDPEAAIILSCVQQGILMNGPQPVINHYRPSSGWDEYVTQSKGTYFNDGIASNEGNASVRQFGINLIAGNDGALDPENYPSNFQSTCEVNDISKPYENDKGQVEVWANIDFTMTAIPAGGSEKDREIVPDGFTKGIDWVITQNADDPEYMGAMQQ